jgi:hypothetical protein
VNLQQNPIIIRLSEPVKSELAGLADVLIGSFGLVGALTLLAIMAGVLMAGVMFWWRSRSS